MMAPIKYSRGVLEDQTTDQELASIKNSLEIISRTYFDVFLDDYELDVFLSINNYHAAYAALAKYHALAVPMGCTESGEPKGLTFIGKSFAEISLLQLGYAYAQLLKERKLPEGYEE